MHRLIVTNILPTLCSRTIVKRMSVLADVLQIEPKFAAVLVPGTAALTACSRRDLSSTQYLYDTIPLF